MFTTDSEGKKLPKDSGQFKCAIFAALIAALLFSSYAYAGKFPLLKKVDTPEVCMITNKHMGTAQIAVPVGENVYYGCCEMCVGTLNNDVKSRYSIDPTSGKKVDKATAVIGALKGGSVLYFENQENFDAYLKKNKP